MTVATPDTAAASDDPPAEASAPARPRREWRFTVVFALLALALGAWVTKGLWSDPYRQVLATNAGDQAWFEWLLGYGVQMFTHGGDPFFTELMNAPLGVNLAANTSITVYILAFAPVSYLLGPQVSFALILTLNLAGGALAWYLFLHRFVTSRRLAAAVIGLFCGFAPGFVAHANGHLNWSASWVAPVVLWWVLKLREPKRWLRNGLVLGVLVVIGFSVAAEGLFFTALASGVFLGTWALARTTRDETRVALPAVLKGLGVTAVTAGALLAYPLYMHFAGPQSFSGTGFNQRHYVEDVFSYLTYSSRSLAATIGLDSSFLAPNPTEETSFFGLPLMVLTIWLLVQLWRVADPGRRATLRALMVTGAVFIVLSWGPRLQVLEFETPIPLPYAGLAYLPLFDSALPARFALVLVGVIGVVLAMALDRLSFEGRRKAVTAAFVVALLPLFPTPLITTQRSAEPAFIAEGTWQQYVAEGGVISALPFANNASADAQRWQAYTMARGGPQFRIPGGYFLGPGGRHGTGRIGAPWRRTDWKFLQAARWGYVLPVTEADREQARRDFEYWDIRAVFLADQITGADGPDFRAAVEITARDLLGEPEEVGDVLVWRIRPGIDPVSVPADAD
jgi:hypothetical protein